MEAVLFYRDRKTIKPVQAKSLKDLTRFSAPALFLAEEKRHSLLDQMKKLSGLEPARYESLCTVLIENLVHYCQSLPETNNSYYSQAGGLVDHALNRTEAALTLFKEFLVLKESNELSEQQKLWQYVLYSAAILQGIGKLFVDYKIHTYDTNGTPLKQWNPLLESLDSVGCSYDYEFLKEPEVEFRRRLNLLLAKALMPTSGFAWIADNPDVLAVWLALLNEDQRTAGTLGAILIRADAIAIQRYFSDFFIRNAAARGGRYGRTGTFSGGVPATLSDKEQAIGAEFIQWLYKGLEEGLIMLNKPPLFMVPGGMLLSKEMFQWFVREHPDYKNWQAIQKSFLSLGLHSQGIGGDNVGRFEQSSTKEMHSGVVFSEFAVALPDSVQVHQESTGKTSTLSATEVIHGAQYPAQFSQIAAAAVADSLHKLSPSGIWQATEQDGSALRIGANHSG